MIPADDLICRESVCSNYGNPGDSDVCGPEHFSSSLGPYRDGKVWVLDGKCPTCIFRPGNLMYLAPGRRDSMVAECIRHQSAIFCHETLDGPHAICRGFYDLHRTAIVALRLAGAMELIEFMTLPTTPQQD